jgi:hypothetical protein
MLLKKLVIILFASLLIVQQYAKQLSYYGCALFTSTTIEKCDCETKVALNYDNNNLVDDSHSTTHKHLKVDDFVALQKIVTNNYTLMSNQIIIYKKFEIAILNGFTTGVIKPPQA